MLKRNYKILNFILLLILSFILTACSVEVVKPTSINIFKDTTEVEELNVLVGDKFNLSYKINNDLELDVIWKSSDVKIINIDENGNVDVKNDGKVIITVTIKDYPYISDSININSTHKVEQLGVGSGLSKNDPIFKGNEGSDEPIEVYFIEMQHIYSDSIFIKKGNVEILIDSGYEYDGKYISELLSQYCTDDRLDLLMFSHSDGDHTDGALEALKNVDNISLMIDYGGVGAGNISSIRKNYKEKGMIYHSAYDCVNKLNGATDVYYLTEDLYFEILNTGNYITNSQTNAGNACSVAVIFYYKNFSFFTAGDLTSESEKQLMKNEDLPEVTLYKASHHGSHGSNSQELLDTLNPKAVAISAARANQYQNQPGKPSPNNTYNLNGASGHPAAAAIDRIYKAPNISRNLNVYWNAVNGTMKFVSYGTNDFEFQGSPTLKGYYDLSLTNGKPVWNDSKQDFDNKVTGEENFKLHESKVFIFRDYIQYLPDWAKEKYFPEYN